MHMVGHDDKGMDEIVFLIEEPYGIGNNGLHTFVGKYATAMSGINPTFYPSCYFKRLLV